MGKIKSLIFATSFTTLVCIIVTLAPIVCLIVIGVTVGKIIYLIAEDERKCEANLRNNNNIYDITPTKE